MPAQPAPLLPVFEPFPKIPRLNREVIVTEKIDGTNASVHIFEDGRVVAASRTRWIFPNKDGGATDNYGFAAWVKEHEDELRQRLAVGSHFGEWWGPGINRGYGISDRRFSLFNTGRWEKAEKPPCCHVVPVLARATSLKGLDVVDSALRSLRDCGSAAAPGFKDPEGVVVFHCASRQLFKVLLHNDHMAKGEA
jgi:RNA ligase